MREKMVSVEMTAKEIKVLGAMCAMSSVVSNYPELAEKIPNKEFVRVYIDAAICVLKDDEARDSILMKLLKATQIGQVEGNE